MSISIEQATVYKVDGRRYLTKQAAIRAKVRQALKRKCECDYCGHPEMPGAGSEDLPCGYHDGSAHASKITRRLTRIYAAALRTQSKE